MSSLITLSYLKIKKENEKNYASNIICATKTTDDNFINIHSSKTYKRCIYIHSSDRMGVNISLIFYKINGIINFNLYKKRTFSAYITFHSYQNIQQHGYLFEYNEKNLRLPIWESLILEYPTYISNYIFNGMSHKWKILENLALSIKHNDKKIPSSFDLSCTNPNKILRM